MTTATVDITDVNKLPDNEIMSDNNIVSNNEVNVSNINTDVDLATLMAEEKIANNNYYYSSGSFKFIFDKGFKPETLEEVDISSVPFVPAWHKGILSIHGLIIPVIDILAFVKTQNLDIQDSNAGKPYYLKLEHKDYSPIVFMLDSLPQLVDTDIFEKTKADDNSPAWLLNNLENNSTKIAFIDHKALFDQMISTQ